MKTLILAFALLVALSGRASVAETPANLVLHPEPIPIPEIYFGDSEGIAHTLADFRGKVVLLNLSTPSCVSCQRELLALDRLQALLGGPSFEVVAVSVDLTELEPKRFHPRIATEELGLYSDTSAMTVSELGVDHLPTTLLIDWDGREIGRLVGPTDWDATETLAVLRDWIDISADGSSVSTSY
jgi:thiol-disulfide isomerase/thioredoxin